MNIPEIIIKNTISLPLIGLGTWMLQGDLCTRTVEMALEIGYRHIDTAHMYENHAAIRRAIHGFDRSQLFLTSKFTLPQLENETLEECCDRALQELDCDYLDLFLMHYPLRSVDMVRVLFEMQQLIEKKKIRAMGVSNFTTRHLQDMLDSGLCIDVNQVEFHPYLNQKELLAYCNSHHIQLMSYRALGKGVLMNDSILKAIGEKYHKTPAQVCLRWLVEHNIPVIPKSSNRKHLEENVNLFDFALDAEDRAALDNPQPQHRFCEREWSDFDYV